MVVGDVRELHGDFEERPMVEPTPHFVDVLLVDVGDCVEIEQASVEEGGASKAQHGPTREVRGQRDGLSIEAQSLGAVVESFCILAKQVDVHPLMPTWEAQGHGGTQAHVQVQLPSQAHVDALEASPLRRGGWSLDRELVRAHEVECFLRQWIATVFKAFQAHTGGDPVDSPAGHAVEQCHGRWHHFLADPVPIDANNVHFVLPWLVGRWL